jgi:PDZ domain-containing protein
LGLVGLVVLLVLVGAFVWADHHLTNDYAITPGVSQPVGPLVSVTGRPQIDRRSIYLTDVYVAPLTVWQWILAEIHPVDEQLVPPSALTGPDVPVAEAIKEGYLEMYDSQNDAKAAAFRALHLRVRGVASGTTVVALVNGAPAAHTLGIGDRIVAANGVPVRNACQLVAALHDAVPGRDVDLRVVRARISGSGTFRFDAPRGLEVPTTKLPSANSVPGCPGVAPNRIGLGIELENSITWTFPVSVSIDTADIGGPSAGLAMTLSIIDALSARSITGGLRVAATGTIAPNGAIGDVGGVAEKTIAVERAGVSVFFVPPSELGAAKSTATPGLRLFAVSSLAQVLADLRTLGGAPPELASDTAHSVTRS